MDFPAPSPIYTTPNRIGVIRHSAAGFEVYRYYPPTSDPADRGHRTSVSHLSLVETQWLAQRMPRMAIGEIVELDLVPEPAIEEPAVEL